LTPTEKLAELGLEVPEVTAPLGTYVPAVAVGGLVFVSGQLPLVAGRLTSKGKLGADVSIAEGCEAARQAALNVLGAFRWAVGPLERVTRVVQVTGYIASVPGFTDQPAVLNGASDLLVEVFGEAGRHSRVAVAAPALPMDSPVEVQAVFEIGGG
jgi:enamine deaminase RidA (YjgF/YER057c/UK114 family)